jgi:aminoglycoside/choline kinase family phosphotransferase
MKGAGNNTEEIRLCAISLSQALTGGPLGSASTLTLLTKGGSDRRFYRLQDGARSAVVLCQTDGHGELEDYYSIGGFLGRIGIAAPAIFGFDRNLGIILMEDLGDIHLEDVLKEASDAEQLALYKNCLSILVRMQIEGTAAMEAEGLLEDRPFDRDVLLGETDYFRREFIDSYCPVPIPEGWDEERAMLAQTLAGEPPVFMHRDFQSRNIIVADGRLRVIDFQTAHRGPGLYDAASLLKDPYHPLEPATRMLLLEQLYNDLKYAQGRVPGSFERYAEVFILAGIQRNLQALAAYARLGTRSGKDRFLESIPAGLDLLEEGVTESGKMPATRQLISLIREKMSS